MKKIFQSIETSRTLHTFFFILYSATAFFAVYEGTSSGLYHSSSGWQFAGLFNWIMAVCAVLFTVSLVSKKRYAITSRINRDLQKIRIPKLIGVFLSLLIPALVIFLGFIKIPDLFSTYLQRAFYLMTTAMVVVFILKISFTETSWNLLLITGILLVGVFYQTGNYLSDVSSNPFTMGWSEGSRYYYASLFFSKKIYQLDLPYPLPSPSRYLMLSLPFLIPRAGIFVHRAWQAFLWIATTGLCAVALVKRLKLANSGWNIVLSLTGFLFLQQGPVYYYLLFSAIMILFGFQKDRFWRSLLWVILASIWTGISRINWYPMPAILAALLYFLENPKFEDGKLWDYLKQPFIFIIAGLVTSFSANFLYVPLSGNDNLQRATTKFTSALLWDRLLPSPTYSQGILLGILLVSAPLLILLVTRLAKTKNSTSWVLRWLLLLVLVVFFVGGLVVSVKIGAGSNLHNMDAFMLLLLVAVYYMEFSAHFPEIPTNHVAVPLRSAVATLMLLLPFFLTLNGYFPRPIYSAESLQHDLSEINGYIEGVQSKKPDAEILFVNQRQLLTFGYVHNTMLVPDYEQLELMEWAISNQSGYLDSFYDELASHRFDLIIINKQYLIYKDKSSGFPEENNAWVKNITTPLYKYYTPITWLRYTDTEIYVPRPANELQRLITQ